jgi:alkylhydroperoxidase family enzyme
MAGYSLAQTQALRRGEYPDDARIDALVKFVSTVVSTRGTLAEETVTRFLAAGFSDRQVVEIISAISAILFTNMINRVNDTVVDFPHVN